MSIPSHSEIASTRDTCVAAYAGVAGVQARQHAQHQSPSADALLFVFFSAAHLEVQPLVWVQASALNASWLGKCGTVFTGEASANAGYLCSADELAVCCNPCLSHCTCACRTRALFAELQDTFTKQWGIPVSLETELEAQRRIQEPDANEQHYLGLSALVAAGVAELNLPLQTARLLLDGELQDAGNDHQKGWAPARRTAAEDAAAAAEAAATLSVASASTSTSSSENGRAGVALSAAEGSTGAAQQQAAAGLAAGMQSVHLSSSTRGSGGTDTVWAALLRAVRGGKAGSKEVEELAQRVMRAQAAAA
jgi:hypothetical protein